MFFKCLLTKRRTSVPEDEGETVVNVPPSELPPWRNADATPSPQKESVRVAKDRTRGVRSAPARMEETGWRLQVRAWIGHSFNIVCADNETLADFKAKVADVVGTPVGMQLILEDGKVLDDHNPDWSRHHNLEVRLYPECARSLHIWRPKRSGHQSGRVCVFDADTDLLHKNLAPSIRNGLQRIHDAGNELTLVSFDRSAVELLKMQGLAHLFTMVACGRVQGVSKERLAEHIFSNFAPSTSFTYVSDGGPAGKAVAESLRNKARSVELSQLLNDSLISPQPSSSQLLPPPISLDSPCLSRSNSSRKRSLTPTRLSLPNSPRVPLSSSPRSVSFNLHNLKALSSSMNKSPVPVDSPSPGTCTVSSADTIGMHYDIITVVTPELEYDIPEFPMPQNCDPPNVAGEGGLFALHQTLSSQTCVPV